jgi:hypothetical protein
MDTSLITRVSNPVVTAISIDALLSIIELACFKYNTKAEPLGH